MKRLKNIYSLLLCALLSCAFSAHSQTATQNNEPASIFPDFSSKGFFTKDAEWYFSAGYLRTSFAKSNVNVSQSNGNNFTVHDLAGHDEAPGAVPDVYRIGRFIDEDRLWAVEIGNDHSKFTSTDGQTALVTGTPSGGPGQKVLTPPYFSYQLHNGLNHFMGSLVTRRPIFGAVNDTSSLSFIGKAGVGPAFIHPYVTINGAQSDVGKKSINNLIGFNSGWWRIVGLSTSVEFGIRYVLFKPLYLELTNKSIFTAMGNIPVPSGKASQNLFSNETLLSIGYTFGK